MGDNSRINFLRSVIRNGNSFTSQKQTDEISETKVKLIHGVASVISMFVI